jgi:hypothetical protein
MGRLSSIKTRIVLLLVLVVSLVAGFSAIPASGALEIYCYYCTVSSVPAVSATKYHYDNYMSVDIAGNLEIYFYNVSTGVTTCGKSVFSTYSVYRQCSNHATARCHTFSGTGARTAYCDATY